MYRFSVDHAGLCDLGFADVLRAKNVVFDSSRIAAEVVSGIGFLERGSILLRGEIVRGLAVADSLWSIPGISLAVGGGTYAASVSATVIILTILARAKALLAHPKLTTPVRLTPQLGDDLLC